MAQLRELHIEEISILTKGSRPAVPQAMTFLAKSQGEESAVKKFFQAVRKMRTDDPKLDFTAAHAKARREHADLYEAALGETYGDEDGQS